MRNLWFTIEGLVWRLLWWPWLHRYQPTGFYKRPASGAVSKHPDYQQISLLEAE